MKKPTEADLEFFHRWLHDNKDRSASAERALVIGSYLLGHYEGAQRFFGEDLLEPPKKRGK